MATWWADVQRLSTLLLVSLALVSTWVQPAKSIVGRAPSVDRYCLACLCSAATNCDVTYGCRQDGQLTLCGPFLISKPFWLDANVTALPKFSEYDFVRCATDLDCAGMTVTSYMEKFSRDCDGDGRVTCKDYGLMHYLGYSQCNRSDAGVSSEFYGRVQRCIGQVLELLTPSTPDSGAEDCIQTV